MNRTVIRALVVVNFGVLAWTVWRTNKALEFIDRLAVAEGETQEAMLEFRDIVIAAVPLNVCKRCGTFKTEKWFVCCSAHIEKRHERVCMDCFLILHPDETVPRPGRY